MNNASDCVQVQSLFTCYQSQEQIFENLGQQESVFQPTHSSLEQPESVPYIPCFGLNDYVEAEVPVPSSDHVAEIVGKRGCKILFLMNTIQVKIVTPRRDQQPIFKVSGERFAVEAVCKLIVEAAEHFSKIQEVRQFKTEIGAIGAALPGNTFSSNIVLMKLAVPHHLVGLLIGWKGQNIQAIKLKTNVEILSPKRFSAPLFQLIGSFENVLKAKSSIDLLIFKHTGKVYATHFVDDFSNTNIPSCDNGLADHRVSQEGGLTISKMEFEQVHCPVPLLNYSDIPSSSSATLPDVMCSRDASEQDQPNSPPVEKKIIRSRIFPPLTLVVTVNHN